MNINTLRTSVAAAMGGAVLLAGLLVGASFALAQETDEPEITVEGDTMERGFHSFRDGARKFGGNLEAIAAELGTTLDELKDQVAAGATLEGIATNAGVDLDALFEQLRTDALAAIDQQVADGNLTQSQADSMKERIESFDPENVFSFGPREFRGERGDGHLFGGSGGFLGDLGLDIDLAELGDLVKSGLGLDEALAELGVDLDIVVADATAAALEHLDELVVEGTITQGQADSMKERIESFDPENVFSFGPREFRGERGDGHLFGGSGGFLGDLGLDIDLAELGDLVKSGLGLDEALAELGVDLDIVVADATAAALEHIDELIAEGTITQEQADQMKEMIESFDLSEGFPFGMRGFKFDLDFENFDMDRFHGPRGDGSTDATNAEDALLDV